MKDERPSKEHKLDSGARRLLYDLRHKTSRQVALEHKDKKEGALASRSKSVKDKAMWLAADSLLSGYPLDYDPASDKRSIWPHTEDPEQYCSFCKMNGCRAPQPKQEQ